MFIIDDNSKRININYLKRCNSTLNENPFELQEKKKNSYNITKKNYSFSPKKKYGLFLNDINKINIQNSNSKSNPNKLISFSKYNTQDNFYSKNQTKATNLSEQFYRNKFYQIPSLFQNYKYNKYLSDINKDKIIKNSNGEDNKEEKENKNDIDINKIGIKERIYKPYLWDNIDEKELINQRDNLMPKGFQFYEKLIQKENKKYFENNYIIKKMPNGKLNPVLIRDAFKQNIEESDLFLQNKNIIKKEQLNEISRNKAKAIKTFYSSDIFNKKIDPYIIKKSGEITYFKYNQINKGKILESMKFTKNTESPNGWRVRESIPSLLNYSSSNYNPLSPSTKNISKTKANIFNDCIQKFKGHNPIKKQKSLSEFVDLTNVNASNYNINYNNVLNKNPNSFKKIENMFTEYYKIYYNYNNISEKPFYKFIPSLKKNINNKNYYNISKINSSVLRSNESKSS